MQGVRARVRHGGRVSTVGPRSGIATSQLSEALRNIVPAGAKAVPGVGAPPRQRAKLWELNPTLHCSIIGTCLTTGELRRTMAKVVALDVGHLTDHDLHGQAVGLCGQHNTSSKLLQKALDQRHELVIRQFARLHGEASAMDAWAEARRAGDIPGAYWAVLTHPDVGHAGIKRAFGDVHMLSHLVGAANRADIRRLAALEAENAALQEKVERQQSRLREAIAMRDATIRQLGALAAEQPAAQPQPQDADDNNINDGLAAFRKLAADLDARLAREATRRKRLEQRLAELSEARRHADRRAAAAEQASAALQTELAALERHLQRADGETAGHAGLPALTLLYVGGRPGCVEQIREAVETAGGVLLCHDGGRHDHPSLLPGLIGQADRVAFPVDCVSHDAALTVKRVCRQFGKTWLPLRSSGLSSLLAALTQGGAGGA